MVQKKGKRNLIITAIGVGLLVVLLGIVALVRSLEPGGNDPYSQSETSKDAQTDTPQSNQDDTPAKNDTPEKAPEAKKPDIDPAKLSTITIDPMNIVVSYIKGVGGFEYVVQRTASGTQYVEFRSPSLAGTKCTNDMGAFASILEKPESVEQPTLTEKITVDGTVYGLSLPDATCTSNPSLLSEYQTSFKSAFGLLKKTS